MAAITLDIGGNTRQLDRDIQKTVNKVYSINLKTKGDQPLGRITGKVNEFTKSLDASNARVIAFGASAGIIYGLQRAFSALVTSTIEVQKSLQDINVILNVSGQELEKFGGQLFNIAKNTGQSFDAVAKAAIEFSRQGLGVAETLKRTNDALILSRLSGLDAAKSVETLTAAVNSFASQAVTASEVVNKFANVDAAFAVSSADLAEAISRVGSSAAQSGVSLNELIAIVTSAQQTTARGGAVIGNSFKTIFTRLERGKVLDLLESLGISTTDSSGQLKSTIQLLQDLGKVYDTLGSQQQAYVAEQVGGVFQINILKAALADLGKEYSIYNSALNVAASSTDQAIKRNEQLNKTYSAQINALQQNATALAAAAGERLLGPSIDRLVGGTNTILEGLGEGDGKGIGAQLGKGILDGIGQFIAGPGLVLIGGVLLKLFKDLAKFATGSVQQLLGLNTSATQQRDLQESINQILAKNPQLIELALKGEQGLNAAANSLLASLQKQTVELQKQATVAAQISKAFMGAGVRMTGGVPVAPTGKPGKASGYIPNFTSDKQIEKAQAIALGATPSVRAHMSQGTIDGKKFVMNNQEIEYPGVGKNGDSMVIPMYGDGPKIAAKGYIPNFARTGFTIGGIYAKEPSQAKIDKISDKEENGLENQAKKLITEYTSKYTNTLKPLGRTVTPAEIEQGFNTVAGAKGALNGLIGSMFEVGINTALDYKSAAREKGGDFDIRGGANLSKIQELFGINTPLADFKVNASAGNIKSFIDKILSEEGAGKFEDTEIIRNTQQIAKRELKAIDEKEALRLGIVDSNGKGISGKDWFPKGTGRGYELRQKIPNASPETVAKIQKIYNERLSEAKGRFGYLGTEGYQNIQKQGVPQKLSKGGTGEPGSQKPASYWASKYSYLVPPFAKPGAGTLISYTPQQGKGGKAAGYIPNFAALQDAISRERSAGLSSGRIYVAQDKRLVASGFNPLGLGVFNTRDEPTASARSSAIKSRGYAGGYIPNFAIENTDTESASLTTIIGTLTTELSGLAFAFAFNKDSYKNSLKEITEANRNAGKVMTQITKDQKAEFYKAAKATGEPGAVLKAQEQIKDAQFAPSRGQKFGAFMKENALGFSMASSILGETGKNLIGTQTKGKRQAGSVVGALGQVGSMAAMGGMIGNAPGAVIGGAVGALAAAPSVIEAFVSDVPELQKAVNQATQNFQKFSEAGAKYFSALEKISNAFQEDGGTNQKMMEQGRKEYVEALSQLSVADQQALVQAERLGQAQEKYAELLEKKRQEEAGAKAALSVESDVTQKITDQSLTRFLGGIPRVLSKGALVLTKGFAEATGAVDDVSPIFETAIKAYTPDTAFDPKSANAKDLEKAFLDISLAGTSGQGQLDKLNQILQTFGGAGNVENIDDLKKILSQTLGDNAGSRRLIEAIEKSATTGLTDDESRQKAVKEIFSILLGGAIEQKGKTEGAIKSDAESKGIIEARTRTLQKERKAIDSTIASLQKNIGLQNLLAKTLDTTAESFRSIGADINIARKFTQPADILESIVGTTAKPAMQARAKSDVALIEEQKRSGLSTAGIDFKENLRSILQKPFEEKIGTIVGKLGEKGGALEGTPADIIKQSDKIQSEARGEAQKMTQATLNVEALMSQFVNGQVSSEKLLDSVRSELKNAGIEITRGTQASNEVEVAIASFSAKSISEQMKAFQQRAKLASETKQAILQEKINQAMGVFGGFEGFMNRPKEEQNYMQKIQGDLDTVAKIRSGVDFRYGGELSEKAREKQMPDLGRAYANIYNELITQSGGAFRDFIQSTIEKGPQLSGQRFNQGMDSYNNKLGGFDDIVAGRKADLDQQLKLAEDKLKTTKDPTLQRDLQGFISSIKNMPGGTEAIARLQTQKQFGVARQSDYEKTYGKYDNASMERLREISPELAATLETSISISDDPLVAEAQLQSGLQTEMVQYLKPIQDAILQIANLSSGAISPTSGQPLNKIEGYTSPLNEEQQKRVEEFKKQQAEAVKKEAEIKAKQAQEAGMVKDTRSPSQIEAETKAQVTQAHSMGMTYDEYKTQFPKGAPTIGPQPQEKPIEAAKPSDGLTPFGREFFKQVDEARKKQQTKTSDTTFTQKDAALNTNTTAINSLNKGIENLTTILTKGNETKPVSGNTTGGTQGAPSAQPQVNTTTSAPVTLNINAQGGQDIAAAVGAAVQNAIPQIIEKVRAALGEKVPPKALPNINVK